MIKKIFAATATICFILLQLTAFADFFVPTVSESTFFTYNASVNDVGSPVANFDASDYSSLKTTSAQLFTAASSNKLEQVANADLTGDVPITVCGWVKFTSRSGTQVIASKWNATGNQKVWQLYHDASSNHFVFAVSSDGSTTAASVSDTTTTANGTWYFVRAWHDPTTDQIGIQLNNGTKTTASVSTGMFSTTTPMTIGAYSTNSNYLDADVDSLSVYTANISDGTATALYNSGSGLSGSGISTGGYSTNIYDHWDMKGTSGNVVGYFNAKPLVRTGTAWDLGKVEEPPVNGEVITKWTGQVSSSNTFTQATLDNMPTYNTTGMNSIYPGIYFDGSNDRLQASGFLNIWNGKPGHTVFVVMNVTIEGQYDYIFQIRTSGSQDGLSYLLNATGNQQRLVYGKRIPADGFTSAASTAIVAGGDVIEVIKVNWRQRYCNVYRNTTSITSTTTFGTGGGNTESANSAAIYLGNPYTTSGPKMVLSQFIVYDRELTAREVTYVTKKLQKKWGF